MTKTSSLSDLHDQVWQHLGRGVADRKAPARHPVLATVGCDGGGEARLVVLRAASRPDATLTIHTDAASTKVAELRRDPRATFLIWAPKANLQIRLRATVTPRPGTEEEWARVPDPSRRAYGGTPPPGSPIEAPGLVDMPADPARFTVLEARIDGIEILLLGSEQHLRALFKREDGWQGAWLAP